MIELTKYTQLNMIDDVFEPLYHDPSVYIAEWKIKRSKLDIKLRFPKVSETSDYFGDWYLPRKNALKHKTFINNGLKCKQIPWGEFKRIKLVEDKIHG